MREALAFLHSRRLVHTQLSSHAVMMVGGRQAKLAQFEGVEQDGAKFKPQKRRSWDEILPWVAPELVEGGQKAEQRSDVYSLCCLIWETVVCKVPWQGLDAEEVEEEVEHGARLPLHGLPRYIRRLLRQGLLWDVAERDLDLDEVRDMLLVTRRTEEEKLDEVAGFPNLRYNEEEHISRFPSNMISGQASGERYPSFGEEIKINEAQSVRNSTLPITSAPSPRNKQILIRRPSRSSPAVDGCTASLKEEARNLANPSMRHSITDAPNHPTQFFPSTSSKPTHIPNSSKPLANGLFAKLPGKRRLCLTRPDQRREISPHVEDCQPNFGDVRERFELLSLPSLIDVTQAPPSSQRKPASSFPKNQQRQEKAADVLKLVEARRTEDISRICSEGSKTKGRVRQLVRMIDVSNGET